MINNKFMRTRPVRRRRTKSNNIPATNTNTKPLLIVDQTDQPVNRTKTISISKRKRNGNSKMTPRHRIFADEWLKDKNGTRAYKVAYPYIKKDDTARAAASRLLTYVNIKAYVNARLEVLSKKTMIDQEWVLKRYKMLTDYSIDDFFNDDGTMKPFSEIPKDKLYAIGGFKQSKMTISKTDEEIIINRIKEFKLPDKKGVLDSLGKHLGMFAKDNEGRGLGQGNIIVGRNIQVNLVDRKE